MSFMLVSGKRFMCSECEKVVQVEYEGGVQMTQIGDFSVMGQMQLSEQLGAEPDNSYLYDIGICSDCFNNKKELKKSDEIFRLIDEIDELKRKYIVKIDESFRVVSLEIIAQWDRDDAISIYGKKLRKILSDEHLLQSKRENQIRDLVRRQNYRVNTLLVETAFEDDKIKEIIYKYDNESAETRKRLEKLLENGDSVFVTKHTNASENLNDYIMTDHTIRYPVEGSVDEVFYFKSELDVFTLISSFVVNSEEYMADVQLDVLIDHVFEIIK